MKALLVCEYREGKVLDSFHELLTFAGLLEAETALFLVGDQAAVPSYDGTVYLADVATYGEYNPAAHKQLLLAAAEQEKPDYFVFSHSSHGWDLAPRVAAALMVAQVSEIVGVNDDGFEVCCCNAKMRRIVKPATAVAALTVQAGAFGSQIGPHGTPRIVHLDGSVANTVTFLGYEQAETGDVDLTRSEVIVSAGRGIGKKENMAAIEALAKALHGEVGASRPVVDAGWVDHGRQVGTTGQTVAPKLYVACGISGAIQHLAGMRKSEFVVAINKDRDAPIGDVADVLAVADVMQLVLALTAKL